MLLKREYICKVLPDETLHVCLNKRIWRLLAADIGQRFRMAFV
jgi:hypothetical protein